MLLWFVILIVRTEHGKLFGSGSNKFGEIGMGKENLKKLFAEPELIRLDAINEHTATITEITCGFRQSFIVVKDKQERIFCTGSNKYSELSGFKGQA